MVRNITFYTKTDTTANGLTSCIIDFLTWEGWQAERINTTGLAREKYSIEPRYRHRKAALLGTAVPMPGCYRAARTGNRSITLHH